MSQRVLPHPELTLTPRAVPVFLAWQEAHGYLGSVVLLRQDPLSKVFQVLPPPGLHTRPAFPPYKMVSTLQAKAREGPSVVKLGHGQLCMSPSLPESLSMARAGFS